MTVSHPHLPRTDRSHSQSALFAFGGRTTANFVRRDELDSAIRGIGAGRSVEITGARFSGRTEVLRRLQLDLSLNDWLVIPVQGVADASPLEAARLGLPVSERASLLQRGLNTPLLQHTFETYVGVRRAVVLVDDADQLDAPSWAVLEGFCRSFGTPIVTTSVSCAMPNAARQSAMRVANSAVRVELLPLGLGEIRGLLEHRLEGEIAPESVGRIHTTSAGNPGVALALIDATVAAGTLRIENGAWVTSSRLWVQEANVAFESFLSNVTPDLRDGLEILSIVGVTELATATALIGVERLEQLDEQGMIETITAGETCRVAVNPPGVAEFFLHRKHSLRRLRLVEQVSSVLTDCHADLEAAYVDAVWRRGEYEDETAPLRTTQDLPHLVRMFAEDHQARRLIVHREWRDERSMRTACDALASELAGAFDTTLLDELILHALDASGDAGTELATRHLRSRAVLVRGGDVDAVADALAEGMAPDFPYAEAIDSLQRAVRIEFCLDQPDLEPLLRSRLKEGVNGNVAGVVLALHYIISGKAEQALPLLTNVVQPGSPFNAYASVLRGLALFLSGRQYEAAAWATDQLQKAVTAVDRISFAGHAYVAGLALVAHDRYDEANDILGIPLRAGISTRSTLCSADRASLTLMSVLARSANRASSADALEHVATSLVSPSLGLPYSDPAWCRAIVLLVAGDRKGARSVVEQIAARADLRGDVAAADHALYLSLCAQFDDRAAAAWRSRVQRVGGELALAQVDARAALTHQDPGALVSAATRLTGLHAPHAATKHYASAARMFRDRGDIESAATARANLQAVDRNRATHGDVPSHKLLTNRETQVVRYIADGLSNGEIASRLMLSVRTVESHINRIARKTGTVNRAERARLARTQSRS